MSRSIILTNPETQPRAGSALRRLSAVTGALALTVAVLFAATLPGGSPAARAAEGPPATAVQSVNINEADAATLASGLNGVGRSRAEEIIRYRETYGPFKTVEELTEVKGIGKSTLEKNRAVITLD